MFRFSLSIRRTMAFALSLVGLISLVALAPALLAALRQYGESSRIARLTEYADELFESVQHFGFERGRVNVVLTDKGDLSLMSGNRAFIHTQRKAADRALAAALGHLETTAIPGLGEKILSIRTELEAIDALRTRAERDFALPFPERDPKLREAWFPAMNSLIKSIGDLLFDIREEVSNESPKNGKAFGIKLSALSLRDSAGPECSLTISVNSGAVALTPELTENLQFLRHQSDFFMAEIKRDASVLESPELQEAIRVVDQKYFAETRSLLTRARLAAVIPAAERVPQKELVDTVVAGLDSIPGIINAAVTFSLSIAHREKSAAFIQLIAMAGIALVIALIILAIDAYIMKALVVPIHELSGSMQRIANDDLETEIKSYGTDSELSRLAESVRIFQRYTKERRLQQELLKTAKDQAEAATKAKSLFLSNMTHEIRNPLNGIIGLTEISLDLDPPPEIRKNLELTSSVSESLLTIVNDILDFEKISSNRVELRNEPFDIRLSLETSQRLFAKQAETKGLALKLEITDDFPSYIEGDKTRFEQILRNLIGNAVKFTDRGWVRITAERGAATAGESREVPLIFEVQDTGPGIPEKDKSTVFDSFVQLDSTYSKRHEGTGLGLSICKSLVSLMGGAIEVESEDDSGTLFRVTLRLPTAVRPESPRAHTDRALQGPALNVLVADDNAINRMIMKHYLQTRGQTPFLVSDGSEMLEMLRSRRVDLIFSDIQMPGMDGMEAIRHIRAGDSGSNRADIPAVAITGYSSSEERKKILDAGFNGYITKPFRENEIFDFIEKFRRAGE